MTSSFPNGTHQPSLIPEDQKNQQSRRWSPWRLWAPLAFQTILIGAIPFQSAFIYLKGQPVTLQTAPVDPYDFLRGYSQTLSYDISRASQLRALPGGEAVFKSLEATDKSTLYVVLQAPEKMTTPPTPWQPVMVSDTTSIPLANNQVFLKGQYENWQVRYNLETYYMPEDQRERMNDRIRKVQSQQAFVVDIKVDDQGNSVPVSLWINQQNYKF
ncbi:GDYXXLXY domain-containing protein [Acaryochloris sp. CCMEE 5410]|uniref:GDYXXLXY domain-containing protein n=1 Tax=Acaryochloris sp. CCMEE 5410 TaxID=310037 RepID=UPI000248495E|nr:GDYXXLXY domain-containing protein [Acaryochloris sp. CCMEE 5410]KAI9131632.1 GDYXXLXY domain-containing protein [Acaryochloris sp. CCMEE 5410]